MSKVLFILIIFVGVAASAQQNNSSYEAGEDFDLEAVMNVMEDAEDLAAFEERARERSVRFEDVVKRLKQRGAI